jgi:hypothetical protein
VKRDRDPRGRFTRGNAGGPGRPPRPEATRPGTHGLDLDSANDVVLHAMELAALSDAWRVIIEGHDAAVVRDLVAHCVARSRLVPAWVLEQFPPRKERTHGSRTKRDR